MADAEARTTGGHGASWMALNRFGETLSRIPKVTLLSVVGPFIALVLGYTLWIYYGAKHLDMRQYGLLKENVILTPQPTWIRGNVLDEVFRGSDLSRLTLLDHQMTAAVYNAFRIHPWVRRVYRVHKLAGGQVQVLVEYREPLAMVAQSGSDGKITYLPVDVDGVLLPTQDFLPTSESQASDIRRYLLIYAKDAVPTGLVGSEYGDPRIKEAVALCRVVKDLREPLGLERVYVYPDPNSVGPSRWHLELTTRSNKRLQWGHAPGFEAAGEPAVPAKLRKLQDILLTPSATDAVAKDIDLVELAKPSIMSKLAVPASR